MKVPFFVYLLWSAIHFSLLLKPSYCFPEDLSVSLIGFITTVKVVHLWQYHRQSSKSTFLLFTMASFYSDCPVDFHPDKSPFLSHYSSPCAIAPPLSEAIKKKKKKLSTILSMFTKTSDYVFFFQESLLKLPIERAQICIAAHDAY